jgi:predicted translation initiation factor SUI1
MAKPPRKTVLFLDTADRGRAAEAAFNAAAGRLGLPWVAVAAELGSAPPANLEAAAVVIALNRDEHEPLFRATFPERAAAVEFWQVAAGAAVEPEVTSLIARLLGGRVVSEPPPPAPEPKSVGAAKKPATVKVSRETAGRRGKGVTVVSELPLGEAELKELAAVLKQKCGTGGTAKDGRIEVQGDHRDRLAAELEKLGYKVKRAGG